MNFPNLPPEILNDILLMSDNSEEKANEYACDMLCGNGKDVQVFVGLIKKDQLHVRWAAYKEPPKVIDDVLSTIILRGRQLTKELGARHETVEKRSAVAESMSLDGVYLIDMFNSMVCNVRNMTRNIPPNVVVFFLDDKTQWKMFSTCPDYEIKEPTLVKTVYKNYYKEFYPKEVLDFAFADPKNIKRVYDYQEVNGQEDFFMEPLFSDSDIVEHVLVPLEQSQAA